MTLFATSDAPDTPPAQDVIIDATQASFMADVVDASMQLPILVDFWATWCGPCKTLTPALERVVRAQQGRVRLVKVDVDKNPQLIAQLTRMGLPLQSVPTVVAFWQGQVADAFQGAVPESELKRFVEALLKQAGSAPPAADLSAQGRERLEAGNAEQAVQAFAAAVEQDAEKPEAWGGLVRALLGLGDERQAAEVLAQLPAKLAEHPEVAGARSALVLAVEGRKAQAAMAGLSARLAANQDDHEARYELATALNASGARTEAAAALLEIIKRDRSWNDDGARKQLLKFFEAWGVADPASLAARRKLSAMLFS
jgi:putative thioredoxin